MRHNLGVFRLGWMNLGCDSDEKRCVVERISTSMGEASGGTAGREDGQGEQFPQSFVEGDG